MDPDAETHHHYINRLHLLLPLHLLLSVSTTITSAVITVEPMMELTLQ